MSEDVPFEIAGRGFEAVKQTGTKGRTYWRFPAEDGSSDNEIDPLADDLPTELIVNGETFTFGPVPKKQAAPGDGPAAFKPFHKTREVRDISSIEDQPVTIHCRVTKRGNGKWWMWLNIDPKKTPPVGEGDRQTSDSTTSPDEALEKVKSELSELISPKLPGD
jgi:hypothetical protein